MEGNSFTMILPFVIMIAAMYLIVFLPQKRKEKKTREMLNAIKVGDKVVSIGGIVGKVINIKDDEITIESAVERSRINFKKWAIREVLDSAGAE
jgi:preprotein translocase subunit YajC